LIKGALNQSAVGTLAERNTRLLILVKLPHPSPATAAHVLQAFTDKLNAVAKPKRKALTYDRGKEMSHHQQLSANTGIAVYFCDPHSPWQRGTNENANGLIRQFLPKGTDLSVYSQEQLDGIADLMNGRPRKTLDWCTPHEVYSGWLAKLDDPTANQCNRLPIVLHLNLSARPLKRACAAINIGANCKASTAPAAGT
jgi:IS30 family transposase